MRTLLLSLALLLVPSIAHANPAMDGVWRVAVMKKGAEKTSLAKKDYTLVLEFDNAKKTWSASVRGDADRKNAGSYTVEGEKVVLDHAGRKHALRVLVNGNQMVLSPIDKPTIRLIALKVK